MTKLKLYEYPHPILKQKAQPAGKVDDEMRKLLDDMLETMYECGGCGLAAPQVGISKRIVVIDTAHEDEEPRPLFLVNPEIVWHSDEKKICEEGCLSVPGMRAEVERPAAVKVKYVDYDGEEQELSSDDFLAVVLQHEIDHLDGILFIDYLSKLKRDKLLTHLEKRRKREREDA